MQFLLSGRSQVSEAIAALEAAQLGPFKLTVNQEGHWLSVPGDPTPETAAAITAIVSRVDPDAVQV